MFSDTDKQATGVDMCWRGDTPQGARMRKLRDT